MTRLNPAELLALSPPTNREGARVVRLCEDDDEGEAIMPKGVYDRSTSKPRGEPKAANDPIPAPAPKKPAKARAAAVVRHSPRPVPDAPQSRFEVALDLRKGAVTINATNGSLTLQPDEIAALFAFLGRRG